MTASRVSKPPRSSLLVLALLASACGSPTASPSGPDLAGPTSRSPATPPAADAAAPSVPAPLPVPPSGRHMGATPGDGDVAFRVWAPNAKAVAVVGEAAGPSGRHALTADPDGTFAGTVAGAHAGQTYRFAITTADDRELLRLDPRGREIRDGASVVVDPRTYAWKTPAFVPPAREASVVYEMHVGSFSAAPGSELGTFASATEKLDVLADLGVNAIELMPVNAHGTRQGWGYNPQSYFAPHTHYGTADDFRKLVDAAHARGIAVLVDVVFNHYDGWSEAPLRCFDGHCPGDSAGAYFFDEEPYRATPWGPRPAFAKKEVSDFFTDAIFAWMTESRVDGFRHDSVSNVRALDGKGSVPGGVELLRRMNEVADGVTPASLLVAEDLKGHAPITASRSSGGLGFDTQWDGGFGWAVTSAVSGPSDATRDIGQVRNVLLGTMNGDPFQRLLYVESHDTAGNDGARLPVKIDAADPTGLPARRRAMLAAGLLLTAPGVPMLFMGQEMLETTKFEQHPALLDWTKAQTFGGVRAFYKDIIRLRRNLDGVSGGLLGPHVAVTHVNDSAEDKVLVYRRWHSGGDDVVVVANFGGRHYTRYDIGLPAGGPWHARVDGGLARYGVEGGAAQPTSVAVTAEARDGLPFRGAITLAPYTLVVLTR